MKTEAMATELLEPIHPGEILLEEFLKPFGLSANALAKPLGVPVTRVSEIVRGRRGVTADTALRLARYFGTSAELRAQPMYLVSVKLRLTNPAAVA